MSKRRTERVRLLTGCEDRMGRPIFGIFEVLLDLDKLCSQMERASLNTTRESWNGAVGVRFQKATRAQAEFFMRNAQPVESTESNPKSEGAATPGQHKATEHPAIEANEHSTTAV